VRQCSSKPASRRRLAQQRGSVQLLRLLLLRARRRVGPCCCCWLDAKRRDKCVNFAAKQRRGHLDEVWQGSTAWGLLCVLLQVLQQQVLPQQVACRLLLLLLLLLLGVVRGLARLHKQLQG
jgi:hypothetical protein